MGVKSHEYRFVFGRHPYLKDQMFMQNKNYLVTCFCLAQPSQPAFAYAVLLCKCISVRPDLRKFGLRRLRAGVSRPSAEFARVGTNHLCLRRGVACPLRAVRARTARIRKLPSLGSLHAGCLGKHGFARLPLELRARVGATCRVAFPPPPWTRLQPHGSPVPGPFHT